MILLKKFDRPHIGLYILLWGSICFLGATVIVASQVWLIRLISTEAKWEGSSIFDYWFVYERSDPSLSKLTISGPILETLLLLVLLYLLNTYFRNRFVICCVSAVIWGLAHALINSPGNGLPSAWIFLILSSSVFDWEDDANKQYLAPLGIHSLSNAMAYFIL
jgi:hypothetical protein